MILQTRILFVDLLGVRATEKENVILMSSVVFITLHHLDLYPKRIEYILEWNLQFTRKKCKATILLYCCHTAGVLHIFFYITFWALEYHFIENLKLMLKENQIMK